MRAPLPIALALAVLLGLAALPGTAPGEPVPAGRQAVAVVVNAAVGAAASVSPGDRVDVWLTRAGVMIDVGSPLLANVPVTGAGETVGGEQTAGVVLREVTLALTRAEARKLEKAQKQGWLALSAPGEAAVIHDPRPPQRVVCPRLWPDDPDFPIFWPLRRRGCTEYEVRHPVPYGAPGDL